MGKAWFSLLLTITLAARTQSQSPTFQAAYSYTAEDYTWSCDSQLLHYNSSLQNLVYINYTDFLTVGSEWYVLKMANHHGYLPHGTFDGFAAHAATLAGYPAVSTPPAANPKPDPALTFDCDWSYQGFVGFENTTFDGMNWVRHLSFYNCDFWIYPEGSFSHFDNLYSLTFSGGTLNNMDSTTFKGMNVQPQPGVPGSGSVYISSIVPSPWYWFPVFVFDPLSNMTSLTLKNNYMRRLFSSMIWRLPNLEYLEMSGQNLFYIPTTLFDYSDALSYVKLHDFRWFCACSSEWWVWHLNDRGIPWDADQVCSFPATENGKTLGRYGDETCRIPPDNLRKNRVKILEVFFSFLVLPVAIMALVLVIPAWRVVIIWDVLFPGPESDPEPVEPDPAEPTQQPEAAAPPSDPVVPVMKKKVKKPKPSRPRIEHKKAEASAVTLARRLIAAKIAAERSRGKKKGRGGARHKAISKPSEGQIEATGKEKLDNQMLDTVATQSEIPDTHGADAVENSGIDVEEHDSPHAPPATTLILVECQREHRDEGITDVDTEKLRRERQCEDIVEDNEDQREKTGDIVDIEELRRERQCEDTVEDEDEQEKDQSEAEEDTLEDEEEQKEDQSEIEEESVEDEEEKKEHHSETEENQLSSDESAIQEQPDEWLLNMRHLMSQRNETPSFDDDTEEYTSAEESSTDDEGEGKRVKRRRRKRKQKVKKAKVAEMTPEMLRSPYAVWPFALPNFGTRPKQSDLERNYY